MRKRRYTRQGSKQRNSLRITLGVAAASATALIMILIIVFNFTRQESSLAGSPMVFVGADTMQDTAFVYRGSANQQGMGLVIQTSGANNPLKVSSVEFKVTVTAGKNADNLENARLWFTGSDGEFACNMQSGNTLPVVGDDKISFEVNKFLMPGKNYFWLTFDIKPEAASPANFDVICMGIKVGALSYLPYITSPMGNRLIAGNRAFYSQGDLLINQPGSWNTNRDGSGESPKDIGNERNVFFIQSGHQMQNVKSTTMHAIIIEHGAGLKSLATLRLKRMVVENRALYEQVASVSDFYAFDMFKVANGGVYVHNNTGYVPGLHCDFGAHSTVKFLQYGQATLPSTVTWGNVLIASTSRINFDIQRNLRHIKGNLEFQSTGDANYLFCDATDTIDIEGNLVFSGGNFTGVTGKNHILTINVKGNLVMNEGTFTDAEAVGTKLSHSILNIGGDIHLLGGTFDFAQTKDAASELNFTGGERNEIKWTQTATEVLLGNVTVGANKQLYAEGPYFGSIAANRTFLVEPDAELYCGKTQLEGPGKFVLDDKAMLGIGHAAGINSTGSEGNIITAKRVFNSGATYLYYQDMNPQKTGKFTTEPWAGTIRNFVVRKDASSHWVILSQDMTVSDQITITQGIVEKNSKRLIKSDISAETERRMQKIEAANK